MRKLIILALTLALSSSLFGCSTTGSEQPSPELEQGSEVDWELVTDAYTFALPLMLMDATQTVATNTVEVTESKAPLNQLRHSTHLVDASFTDVVTPNVDTIYTQASLDLSEDALVFHKPAADRFLSIEVMDFYTNSVAILGTGGDTQEACTYVLTGPDWQGEIPGELVQVAIPTNNASLIVRTLIEDEADMQNVAALQAEMQLVPLSVYNTDGYSYTPPTGQANKDNDFIPVEHVLSLSPEEYFSRANELMLTNPPAAADAPLLERLAAINVGPGLSFDAAVLGSEGESGWTEMISSLESELVASSSEFMRASGAWQFFGEPIAEFGTEYDFRALVALVGLGANPVSVAIYPKAETDDAGTILEGSSSYVIHFDADQLPPVEQYGFWSITAYGEDNFLIDNELNRYSINDRSELVFNEDGSLDVLVQATPPQNDELQNNWLPVNAEQFHLYLRIYLPAQSALDSTWIPPTIETV